MLLMTYNSRVSQDAVTELHNIFKWAKKSSNGLLLFIDEAEAFLSSRSCKYTPTHMRACWNNG
jgi:ATPase family AAA domain-containing protein 3A/B